MQELGIQLDFLIDRFQYFAFLQKAIKLLKYSKYEKISILSQKSMSLSLFQKLMGSKEPIEPMLMDPLEKEKTVH